MVLSISRALIICLIASTFLLTAMEVFAGNTMSVNRGTPMKTLWWSVVGVNCIPTTAYPSALPDGIFTAWTSAGKAPGVGSTNFGGVNVAAPAGSYNFTCTVPGDTDTAVLVVCDNVTQESDGASGCVPKTVTTQPRLLICPDSMTLTAGDVAPLAVRYWADLAAVPDCSTAGYSTVTDTAAWTSNNSAVATVDDVAPKGDVTGVAAGTTNIDATYSGITSSRSVTISAVVLPTISSFTGPASVLANTSPTLDWNVSNATSCTINPGGYVTAPVLAGSQAMAPISSATTYTLRCVNGASAPVTQDFTVGITVVPVPTINSFTGPASVPTNGSPNLSWNVSDVTSCTINPGAYATAPVAAGNHSMPSISSATTYTLSCMNGASGPTTQDVTVAIADPNVVIDSKVLPGTSLVRDTAVTLRGTARNAGGVSTSVGFSNNFSYDLGAGWVNPPAGYGAHGALAGGATASEDTYSFTPTALGNVRFQYCVDSYNNIPEGSIANEVNCESTGWLAINPPVPSAPTGLNAVTSAVPLHCGGKIDVSWNPMTDTDYYQISTDGVSYTSIGTATTYQLTGLTPGNAYTVYVRGVNNISGNSTSATDNANASAICTVLGVGNCTIADGAKTCSSTVIWDITGAVSPNIYNLTRALAVPGTTVASGTVPLTLYRSSAYLNGATGNNTIQARDNTTEIIAVTPTASCGASSFFHTTDDVCRPNPNISITPNPAFIRSGETANLTFGILANYSGVTCNFIGGMSGAATVNHTASAARTYYNRSTDVLTAAQVVRISCTAPGMVTPNTAEVRINVLPEIEEI